MKRLLFIFACLMGSCEMAPAIVAPAAAMGLQINPESDFLVPRGWTEYQKSKTNDATFSKLQMGANGEAGFSYIWINGTPMMVKVYWPDYRFVNWTYPWYDVSGLEPNPTPVPPGFEY